MTASFSTKTREGNSSSPNRSPGGVDAVRMSALEAPLHPESLLNIPLVYQAFCDVRFGLVERAIDPKWRYERAIPISVTGFNPFQGSYFYARDSFFSRWLSAPCGSAREFNENDFLVREVLFMAHDYLHSWAYQVMNELYPEKGILSGPITPETFEDYVFYHLVTEAVATVGLDYWFLSTRTVNQYCKIGSEVGPLTVNYREARIDEYRRFCPDLEVQAPEFLTRIATFYCSGLFLGFGVEDLRRSPQLFSWLKHELQYGETQRALTRSWLSFLAPTDIDLSPDELKAPLSVSDPFRQDLLKNLSDRLWQKVHRTNESFSQKHSPGWQPASAERASSPHRAPDFRFLNLNHTDQEQWSCLTLDGRESFNYFLYQYLSPIPFRAVTKTKLSYLNLLQRERNVQLVFDLFGDLPRLEPRTEEPRDLFTAN